MMIHKALFIEVVAGVAAAATAAVAMVVVTTKTMYKAWRMTHKRKFHVFSGFKHSRIQEAQKARKLIILLPTSSAAAAAIVTAEVVARRTR